MTAAERKRVARMITDLHHELLNIAATGREVQRQAEEAGARLVLLARMLKGRGNGHSD